MSECHKPHVEGPSDQCPWCRIDALAARLADAETALSVTEGLLMDCTARLAEAERLLRIVDGAAGYANLGRYWLGLYYRECEAIRSFVRPADSAPGEKP